MITAKCLHCVFVAVALLFSPVELVEAEKIALVATKLVVMEVVAAAEKTVQQAAMEVVGVQGQKNMFEFS